MAYRIVNWDSLYENNRSREIKNAEWFPCPNSFDGDGYLNLVAGKDGAIAYAGWVLLLGVASRCSPRGTLIQSNGKPHTAETIACKVKMPVRVIRVAIERARHEKWLDEIPHPPAVCTAPSCGLDGTDLRKNAIPSARTEREGEEELNPARAGAAASEPDAAGFDEVLALFSAWAKESGGGALVAAHNDHRPIQIACLAWEQSRIVEDGQPVAWWLAVGRCVLAAQGSGTEFKGAKYAVTVVSRKMRAWEGGMPPEPPASMPSGPRLVLDDDGAAMRAGIEDSRRRMAEKGRA